MGITGGKEKNQDVQSHAVCVLDFSAQGPQEGSKKLSVCVRYKQLEMLHLFSVCLCEIPAAGGAAFSSATGPQWWTSGETMQTTSRSEENESLIHCSELEPSAASKVEVSKGSESM